MISDKMLDIFVAVAMFLVVLFGLGAIMIWGLNKAGPTIEQGDSESAPLVKKNGLWVVPADRQPEGIDELQEAAAVTMIPYRREIAPANKNSAERDSLARSVENFLPRWETFDPVAIRGRLAEGRPNPYLEGLRPWSDPNELDVLAARRDATDPPGVCATCAAGLTWLSGGQISDSLRIGELEGDRAYVWVSGLVRYRARPGDDNPRDGQILNRTYGLILNKEGRRWLVSRVAVEPGVPLS
jgi:hypothetical protein